MAFGSQASCTTISATSTWSRRPCNPSTTRSARGCHPCLRYDMSPICPGRTKVGVVRKREPQKVRNALKENRFILAISFKSQQKGQQNMRLAAASGALRRLIKAKAHSFRPVAQRARGIRLGACDNQLQAKCAGSLALISLMRKLARYRFAGLGERQFAGAHRIILSVLEGHRRSLQETCKKCLPTMRLTLRKSHALGLILRGKWYSKLGSSETKCTTQLSPQVLTAMRH